MRTWDVCDPSGRLVGFQVSNALVDRPDVTAIARRIPGVTISKHPRAWRLRRVDSVGGRVRVHAPATIAMKLLTTLLVCVAATAASSHAQTPIAPAAPVAATATPQETQDHAQMLAALAASAAAWNRGDLPAHLAIYDESITTMTKSGPRPSVAAIEQSFRATYFTGDKPRQQLRFEQATIRMLSSTSALMTGRFILAGGGEAEQSGWFSLVWLRTDAGWKVVHDHTS